MKKFLQKCAIGAGILLVLYVIFFALTFQHRFRETFTATVTDKTVKRTEKTDKYLIFTDKETLENTDSSYEWKWNSSDLYGKLQPGKKYKFKVYGVRVQMWSQYRNIIDAEPVE